MAVELWYVRILASGTLPEEAVMPIPCPITLLSSPTGYRSSPESDTFRRDYVSREGGACVERLRTE